MSENENSIRDTFMYHLIQQCGYMKTLEVFFRANLIKRLANFVEDKLNE